MKHHMRILFLLPVCFAFQGLVAQTVQTSFTEPPAWSENAIWYQIFVERFYNGNRHNDPVPDDMNSPAVNQVTPAGWSVTPWTQNWYKREAWAGNTSGSFNSMVQHRRYGGDLQGVLKKLAYLQQLGITAIYLNPVNDAPSLHKYDARYYHHVDIHFGPDPEGDKKIIAKENPADPSTWQWTAADKLLLQVVKEAHKRKIKVILDYSWNHIGTMFWAWQDVLKHQEQSVYKDWFDILRFDDPSTPQNEFTYKGWLNIRSLPELKKVNISTERKPGYPYEGNLNQGAKDHVFAVTKRWLAPDGDTSKGIDGFRLDVAEHVGLGFWRDYRKFVRSIQPNAYLVGEIWWEQWPHSLMNPAPFTKGDVFDAVMFYQVYRPARSFFAKTNTPINAKQFKDSLEFQWNRLRPATRYAMMNVSSTHDAPRLLTCFYNPTPYKYRATPHDDSAYKSGKPDAETYRRTRLYLTHLFTSIGAPQIWNGEEMGMWGTDDPDCRKPLWWKEFRFEPETRNNYQPGPRQYDPVGFNEDQYRFYRKLIAIRKQNPVLSQGDLNFMIAEGNKLGYQRTDGKNEVLVLFNTADSTQYFDLPGGSYVDLLTGKRMNSGRVGLEKLSSVILKKVQ